jgi:DNA polymerase-3 subunit chi
MTRIDFYHDAGDKHLVACKLAAKARQQNLRVLIYSRDDVVVQQIDKMLWTFQAVGFLPHCMATHPLAGQTPVLLARDGDTLPHDEVLVNLDLEYPPAFARFQRLVEIVGAEDADRQAARQRYRFYRDRGYPIQSHSLAGNDG